MNFEKKKQLEAKTLKVGKNRIRFSTEGLNEIKEAITKEDIRTLFKDNIITIKPIKGRRKIKRRTTRRGPGKIKIKVKNRKRDYVRITRRLRSYLKQLRSDGKIDTNNYQDIRKKIKMRTFKNKASFKEYLGSLGKSFENISKLEKTEKTKETKKSVKKVKSGNKK
jgi:large subunit ribosomal protein L19e